MTRRFWGFALALAIGGAPLAPAVCGVSCASREMAASAARAEHHSCHSPSANGPTVTPAVHPCGHQNDGPTGLRQTLQPLDPPAMSDAIGTTLIALDVTWLTTPSTRLVHSPPGQLALSTHLRI